MHGDGPKALAFVKADQRDSCRRRCEDLSAIRNRAVVQEIEEKKKEREGGADVDGNQTRDDRRRGASLFQTRNEYFKNHMREDYCREAASQILELEKETILFNDRILWQDMQRQMDLSEHL